MISFVRCFQSEWLKTRHTAAAWIVILGACFMPLIVFMTRLADHFQSGKVVYLKDIWAVMYHRNWIPMGMFFLLLMLILSTSLITNIEFKNNTWKQLHTAPLSYTTIYLAKLLVIFAMVVQFFILFNICIYLTVVLPGLIFHDLQSPASPYPVKEYMRGAAYFFIDCLPVIGLQYLLSLKFKNFIVSVGIGFSMLVISLLALEWKYGYISPYIYLPLNFQENRTFVDPAMNRHYWATAYFLLLTVSGYVFYITKKDKS